MESEPFRRIKNSFGIVEKALVVMHGLPVLDHSALPPCDVLASYTTSSQGRVWLPALRVTKRAAQFSDNVKSFLKIYLNCFPAFGGKEKIGQEKRAETWAF